MKYKLIILINLIIWLACGDTSVEVDKSTYRPKIVVDAVLYTGKAISNIKISRNFPLNTIIIEEQRIITDAFITISDAGGLTDTLIYSVKENYHAENQRIQIVGGATYRLYVSAVIDGEKLWTSSSTTAPYPGFSIDHDHSSSGDIPYLQHNTNGSLTNPRITFNRSAGAEFYGVSAVAVEGDSLTFIEDNIFGVDREILDDNMNYFTHISTWASAENQPDGKSTIEIPWWLIYFYSPYRITVYAGDLNFYHFFITHNNVQNIDGNLREPLFYFDGDGIGLFGSAIRDSIYFNVIP
jgi:hypothetical protein